MSVCRTISRFYDGEGPARNDRVFQSWYTRPSQASVYKVRLQQRKRTWQRNVTKVSSPRLRPAGWHVHGGSEPDLPATASLNNREGYVPLYN